MSSAGGSATCATRSESKPIPVCQNPSDVSPMEAPLGMWARRSHSLKAMGKSGRIRQVNDQQNRWFRGWCAVEPLRNPMPPNSRCLKKRLYNGQLPDCRPAGCSKTPMPPVRTIVHAINSEKVRRKFPVRICSNSFKAS